MRDGTPVGQVRASMFVPAGYVKCEGATVNRSNYPRLVALANKYSLWTTDTANNPGKFGNGNGSTTMVLPNWTGRMAQFAATAGGKVDAGLPNITGNINSTVADTNTSGAFRASTTTQKPPTSGGTSSAYIATVTFNAYSSSSIYSASTTVQPPAVNAFAIMRY